MISKEYKKGEDDEIISFKLPQKATANLELWAQPHVFRDCCYL